MGTNKNAAVTEQNESVTNSKIEQNPRSFALSQDFVNQVGVKRETLRVPISRPIDQAFFEINPNPDYRLQVPVILMKEDRETYIVDRSLIEELQGEWVPKLLVTCKSRQGGYYLWPIRLPGPDGKIDTWNESALHIANSYAGKWIRVTANRELGAYDVIEPITPFPPAEWPIPADELLRKAFRGHVIESLDHPVIKNLRGV